MRHEEIQANNCDHFNWEKLLENIEVGKIIPVIGHGLYWIEKEGKGILLYDYLADKFEEMYEITSPPCANHRFYTVMLECLKKKNILPEKLAKELKKVIESEELIPCNPLVQLARIKGFHLFITTAYDEFLFRAISEVRKGSQVDSFGYSPTARYINDRIGECLNNTSCTLLFHILGDFSCPSLTEADILETILELQKDLKETQLNIPIIKLSTFLKKKSFLFIGCGYDDWLFRLFIRAVANEEYLLQQKPHPNKFISDNLLDNKKDPFNEFPTFLMNYQSEVYHICNGKEFVDTLFKKLEAEHPDQVIPLSVYPAKIFISFKRTNESAAVNLAENLRSDGFDVWLEGIKPGDPVDEEILKAIEERTFFIPIISRESKKFEPTKGKLGYYIHEWGWAYSNHKAGRNPKKIIPVRIDDSTWMYDKFENFSFVSIPGGDKGGKGYDKLINKLKEPII